VLRERWYDDLILDQVKVWGAMTANPITVQPDVCLSVAAQLMRNHKIGGLPVAEKAPYTQSPKDIYDAQAEQGELKLVGIVTETDLLDYLVELLSGQAE